MNRIHRHEKIILYGLVLVLVLALGGIQWRLYSARPTLTRDPFVIGVSLADLGHRVFLNHYGEPVTLSDLAQENMMLIFLHSQCLYCQLDAPLWQVLDHNTVVVGVTRETDQESVEAFARLYSLDFPILLDPEGLLAQRLGVVGTPTKFALSSDLHVVQTWMGRTTRQSPQAEIGSLLTLYGIAPDVLPDLNADLSS